MKSSNHLTILAVLAILTVSLLYFSPIWKNKFVPFPGHLLVSYFSPWKEESWPGYPTGVPRKDLLGFDTARMMGPWRHFITNELKQGRLPTWNPHQFTGAPLLANFQSATFFPPNLIYLILPFSIAWTVLVISQPILAALGMHLLLKKLFDRPPSIVHRPLITAFLSLAYGFSAWMSAWIEWNIHGFVYALLPWTLWGIIKKNNLITIITIIMIILAGHPQMALIALTAAAIFSAVSHNFRKFLSAAAVALVITSIQWIPAIRYWQQASRQQPSSEFVYEKTLLPWNQISQLVAPNFLGNPATGNFRGQANFVETTAYSGIAILGFAAVSVIKYLSSLRFSSLRGVPMAIGTTRQSPGSPRSFQSLAMTVRYPLFLLILVLILSLPTPLSLLIGKLNIPILSTSVASRWLILWPLATVLLAASGVNQFVNLSISNSTIKARPFLKRPGLYLPVTIICVLIGSLWITAFLSPPQFRSVSIRNLIVPTGIAGLFVMRSLLAKARRLLFPAIIIATLIELILFGHKTMTYTEKDFIYPSTPVIKKLQELSADYTRFASTPGSSIESNFATAYGLYDLAGYDALYPRRVGELVWTTGNNGKPVSDFSRSTVVTPTNPSPARDNLWNLTGVRWIINKDDMLAEHPGQLSNDLSGDFKLIWEEGKWQIYENTKALPRAFFTADPLWLGESTTLIEKTLASPPDLSAITPAQIITYQPNLVTIEVDAPTDGYLILTDTFYPGWQAAVDNKKVKILPALHAFRSIPVSNGEHVIEFKFELF